MISFKRIKEVIVTLSVWSLVLITMSCFYVEKSHEREPDNRSWYLGALYKDGKKVFVPGDVPESALRQKRTAEYKVQSLVIGAKNGFRPYNSQEQSVTLPDKKANEERAIDLKEISKRKMNAVKTTNDEKLYVGQESLENIFITDFESGSTELYNLETKEKTSVACSKETTDRYFGKIALFNSDITVTLQGTAIRFSFYNLFLTRWKGPISAVLCIKKEDLSSTISRIQEANFPRRFIMNIVINDKPDYPINYLRNLAIASVSTTHFFLADMDVWPTPTLYNSMISLLNPGQDSQDSQTNHNNQNGNYNQLLVGDVANRENVAIIVPVFEYTKACTSFDTCVNERSSVLPRDKKRLNSCLKRKVCRKFRDGQDLHNYYFDEWYESNFTQPLVKVKCFVKDKQEPYLILRKSDSMPLFDERFINYGYNKVQWVTNLRYFGYHFYVLGTDFAMDIAHPRSTLQKNFLNTMKKQHVILNQHLYNEFLSSMVKHNRRSVTRTCGRGGLEIDLNASIDFYICLLQDYI